MGSCASTFVSPVVLPSNSFDEFTKPDLRWSVADLEKLLNRGKPPAPNATREELRHYLSKFRILLQTETNEDDTTAFDAPDGGETFNKQSIRHNTVKGIRTDVNKAVDFKPRVEKKDNEVHQFLERMLLKQGAFSHLDDRELNTLIEATKRQQIPKGIQLYEEGTNLKRNAEMYFLFRGEVEIIRTNGTEETIYSPAVFGTEITSSIPRQGTVTTRSECIAFTLDEEHYRLMLTRGAHAKRERYVGWLDNIPWLSNLSRKDKVQLADALEAVKFQPNEKIIEYGVVGEWMYIIEEGIVDVLGYDTNHRLISNTPVCSFTIGECIGELEFIAEDPKFRSTQADVIARTPVRAVRLNHEHFELCMGPVKDVLKNQVETMERFHYYRSRVQEVDELNRK